MPRVLLVEDNDVNRAMLVRRLQQNGHEVIGVGSAEECERVVMAAGPDIVLMDLGLPGRDGWEATRLLKADPATAAIPVIALSAHAQPADRARAVEAGCFGFESKPIDLPSLLSVIGQALGTRSLPEIDPPEPHTPALGIPLAAGKETLCPIHRKSILVVEDTAPNRVMLRRKLEAQGYQVTEAADGRAALSAVNLATFDLVLLDIMMPEMDGFEVLSELKADPDLAGLPVIMISALDDMASIVRCIEAGAEDYLTKPYDPVLLKARINACLDKRRVRDEERARLKAVARLADAASAIENGAYRAELLDDVAAEPNELGRLARVFQRMAAEVIQREVSLRQEVERLRVEIDEGRKAAQVAEVTESEYFQHLERRAAQLRRRNRGATDHNA